MKARSLLSGAVLALVGFVSAPAFAGDAKTYKIDLRDHWKVGDVTTSTSKDTESQNVLVKAPDGTVVQEQKTSKTTEVKVVQKVLEVDDTGRITKSVLYFVAWNLQAGEDKDDSLTGLHVEVSGLGKLRNWKVVTPGKMPSEVAKAWLDSEHGNKKGEEGTFEAAMGPKKEVAVGESWDGNIEELAKTFQDNFKIDVAKSSAKMTLKGVEGTVAAFDIEIALQTTAVASPGGEMAWKEGGLMTIKMSGTHSLEVGNGSGSGDMTFGLKGVADAQGMSVTLDVSGHKTGGTTLGGEMPEPKAEEGGGK